MEVQLRAYGSELSKEASLGSERISSMGLLDGSCLRTRGFPVVWKEKEGGILEVEISFEGSIVCKRATLPSNVKAKLVSGRTVDPDRANLVVLGDDENLYFFTCRFVEEEKPRTGKESHALRDGSEGLFLTKELSSHILQVVHITHLCVMERHVIVGGIDDMILVVPFHEGEEIRVLKEPMVQRIWKGLVGGIKSGCVVNITSCTFGRVPCATVVHAGGTVCVWSLETFQLLGRTVIEGVDPQEEGWISCASMEEAWRTSDNGQRGKLHLSVAYRETVSSFELLLSCRSKNQMDVVAHKLWSMRAPGQVVAMWTSTQKMWAISQAEGDLYDANVEESVVWWASLVAPEEGMDVRLEPVVPFDWEMRSWIPNTTKGPEYVLWKRIVNAYPVERVRELFLDNIFSDGVFCWNSMQSAMSTFSGQSREQQNSQLARWELRAKVLELIHKHAIQNPHLSEADIWEHFLQEYRRTWYSMRKAVSIFCSLGGVDAYVLRSQCICMITEGNPIEFHAAGVMLPWTKPFADLAKVAELSVSLLGNTGMRMLESFAAEPNFRADHLPRFVTAAMSGVWSHNIEQGNEHWRAQYSAERYRVQKVIAAMIRDISKIELSSALNHELLHALRGDEPDEEMSTESVQPFQKNGLVMRAFASRFRRMVSLRMRYAAKLLIALECSSMSGTTLIEDLDSLCEELCHLIRHYSILHWLASTFTEERRAGPAWMSFDHAGAYLKGMVSEGASSERGISLLQLCLLHDAKLSCHGSLGVAVTEAAYRMVSCTFSSLQSEGTSRYSTSTTWPSDMVASVALSFCCHHQMNALQRLLSIFEAYADESASCLLDFARALWHCVLMQECQSQSEKETHLSHAISSFSRAVPVLHLEQASFKDVIVGLVQALTRTTLDAGLGDMALKMLYSEGLMLFFERLGCPRGAQHFALICARLLLQSDENFDTKSKKASRIWNNYIAYAMQLEEFEEAYASLHRVDDPDAALECLRHLVLSLCTGKKCKKLFSLPFAGVVVKTSHDGEMSATSVAKEAVVTLAGHAELSSLKSQPHPYHTLASFLQQRSMFGTSWMALSASAQRARVEWTPSDGAGGLDTIISEYSMARCTLSASDGKLMSGPNQLGIRIEYEERSKRRRLSAGALVYPPVGGDKTSLAPTQSSIEMEYTLMVALRSLAKVGITPSFSTEDMQTYANKVLPVLLSQQLYEDAFLVCMVALPPQDRSHNLDTIFSAIAHNVAPRGLLENTDWTVLKTHGRFHQGFGGASPKEEKDSQHLHSERNLGPLESILSEYDKWLDACQGTGFLSGILLSARQDMPVSHWLSWVLQGGSIAPAQFALLIHFFLRHRMHEDATEWALDYLRSAQKEEKVGWSPVSMLEALRRHLLADMKAGGSQRIRVLSPIYLQELQCYINNAVLLG